MAEMAEFTPLNGFKKAFSAVSFPQLVGKSKNCLIRRATTIFRFLETPWIALRKIYLTPIKKCNILSMGRGK